MTRPKLDSAALDELEQRHVPDGMFTRTDAYQTIAQARLALAQAERIAKLEAELAESQSLYLDSLMQREATLVHAATLRDALDVWWRVDLADGTDMSSEEYAELWAEAKHKTTVALASTPAQSLAAHDAEVLERLFPAPSDFDREGGWTIDTGWLQRINDETEKRGEEDLSSMEQVQSVLDSLRALAAQAQEVKP